MIPGPDEIIECLHCKSLARVFTLISGNTFGARRWTDGRMDAPMLPQPPGITRCESCNQYYWISDARVVGELEPLEFGPAEWNDAPPVRELDESEYLEAIRLKLGRTREMEINLRLWAWWAGNDRFRAGEGDENDQTFAETGRSSESDENMRCLMNMLDEADIDQRLTKAEILRELGEFNQALLLLQADIPHEYSHAYELIGEAARNHNAKVMEL